ncbi:amidohydrolase family protein [Desulfurivibrio dismutans]|uniref:amidohydrolase family protein n=1 Tax=Desulfurivibrio dismutans TaxID=1398908 RepID=UPI0023DB1A26|nr:amidohydrolase family protein [Desulfurivibrio alkaliphilus]MDF1614855.1 amidohydrolase family protein [Desulfurivibrio alkaliphilus]
MSDGLNSGRSALILAGNLVDGSGGAVQRRVLLTVDNGVIAAIDAGAEVPVGASNFVDLSHCTIVPPLVDCSVVLARSPSLGLMKDQRHLANGAELEALLARHLYDCHSHGVLGVADGGYSAGLVAARRKPMADDDLVAIRTAGSDLADGLEVVPDPAATRDFLKIHYSSDIENDATPDALAGRLRLDDLVRHIRYKGELKAVVVANGAEAVAAALAAGCDAVEQGYDMGEENLRRLAARKVLWIPSLLRAKNALDGARGGGDVCCRFSQRYVAPGKPLPGGEELWRRVLGGQLLQLRRARELGVQVAIGTGAGRTGILHGEAVVEEMKLFAKAGFPLPETIRCASVNGAEFFGLDHLGQLVPGRPATFLISRGSAGQLPRKLSYLENIFINGAASKSYQKNPLKPG